LPYIRVKFNLNIICISNQYSVKHGKFNVPRGVMKEKLKWHNFKIKLAAVVTLIIATLLLFGTLGEQFSQRNNGSVALDIIRLVAERDFTMNYVVIVLFYILALGIFRKNLFAIVIAFPLISFDRLHFIYQYPGAVFRIDNIYWLASSFVLVVIYFAALHSIIECRRSNKPNQRRMENAERAEPGVSSNTFK